MQNLQFSLDNYTTISEAALSNLILECDKAYRTGDHEYFHKNNALLPSDKHYDEMVDHLAGISPSSPILAEIGFIDIDDERMSDLPIRMGSMYKIKNIEEYFKWLKSKGIPNDATMIITMKYDGASLLVDESNVNRKAWTRGNGLKGQKSDAWISVVRDVNNSNSTPENFYSFGEVILPNSIFFSKYEIDTSR